MKKIILLLIVFSSFLFAGSNDAKYDDCVSDCRSEMRICRDGGNDPRQCLDKRNVCVKKCRDLYMDGETIFKKK